MGIITQGNIIQGNAIPGSKPRITYLEAVPTDTNVGGSSGVGGAARTPVNGELAINVLTGNVYERTGVNTWTRADTL
jgi:hypothetical protein